MTGQHIKKLEDDKWQYPCHEDLQWKCGLFSIETYIERRRGTLHKYLDEYRVTLMKEAAKTRKPAKNANKILWWRQKYITKEEMTAKTNFWKKRKQNGMIINN